MMPILADLLTQCARLKKWIVLENKAPENPFPAWPTFVGNRFSLNPLANFAHHLLSRAMGRAASSTGSTKELFHIGCSRR